MAGRFAGAEEMFSPKVSSAALRSKNVLDVTRAGAVKWSPEQVVEAADSKMNMRVKGCGEQRKCVVARQVLPSRFGIIFHALPLAALAAINFVRFHG